MSVLTHISSLETSAHERGVMGFRSMYSAPRDGTIVELKCTISDAAPWYGLFRWTNQSYTMYSDGTLVPYKDDKHSWHRVGGPGGAAETSSLFWRPYLGNPKDYVDPTGGAQYRDGYWRGAIARKYGFPLDHFDIAEEKTVRPLPWWKRLIKLRRSNRSGTAHGLD